MCRCWWTAPNSEVYPEILGIREGAKEDKSGWSAFLRHLVDRRLNGVQLIISDACRGLVESAAEYLPEAGWQRCVVHFYRNIFSHVPVAKVRDVADMLKAIHAQESREAAAQKARAIIEELRADKMSKTAELIEHPSTGRSPTMPFQTSTGRRSGPTTRWNGS
jgi:putative transposase